MSIKREKVKLLIPDASPLISLAHGGEDCLELIFKTKLPVVMTDQVLKPPTGKTSFKTQLLLASGTGNTGRRSKSSRQR